MSDILQIQFWSLASAYIFVVILLFIVRSKKVGHESQIILASIRMTIQLIIVGYILEYIILNPTPLYTILAIVIMEIFAIKNIYDRIDEDLNKSMKRIIALSMISGTIVSIIYFLFVVVRIEPWYMTQYFIPISGMLIGNSMTGISLGAERLSSGIRNNKNRIETALMLGATAQQATAETVRNSFYAAILPTINSMMGMGIIFIPGMMTGQILSGTSPVTAIKYQIAIMMGILGSVTLTVFLMVHWGYKTYFNDRVQLDFDNE